MLQTDDDPFLVQDPQDDLFAVYRREGGNPEVVVSTLPRKTDPAILRDTALRDIYTRHDLDPRDNGRLEHLADSGTTVQDAVNPESSLDVFLFRFDVDVGRLLTDGAADQRVHQADHLRTDSGLPFLNAGVAFLLLFLLCLDGASGCSAVALFDGIQNFRLGGIPGVNIQAGEELELVQRREIKRIGHRNREPILRKGDREKLVLHSELVGDLLHRLRIYPDSGQIHPLNARVLGQKVLDCVRAKAVQLLEKVGEELSGFFLLIDSQS